jgi:hypothetical protein
MEPEGSLPHSRGPAICPYHKPARSNPCFHIPPLKIHLNIMLPYTPGFSTWFLYLMFLRQNSVYASTIPPTRYMPCHFIFPDFIARKILGEGYKSLSSSLIIFLHSLVTSYILGPNILLKTLLSNTLSLTAYVPPS